MKTSQLFLPLLKNILLASIVCYHFSLCGQSAIKQVGPEYINFPLEAYFAANGRVFLSTQGGIYSSDNGSGQWQKVNASFNSIYFNSASFVKSKEGRIYVWSPSEVHSTSDNGNTWEDWFLFFLPTPNSLMNSIAPQGDTLFIAMKAGLGFALKGNALVEPFAQFNGKNIVRVEVQGNSILAIGSDSKVYLSVDRGATWTNNPDLPFAIDDGPFRKFDRKGNTLVAANDSGVWLSVDFGKNWARKIDLPTNPTFLRDVQIDGDEVFAANSINVFKSSLDLSGWQAIFTSVPYQYATFISVQGNQAFIGDNQILIKTSDRGLTWTPSSIKGIYDARIEYFSTAGTDGSILAFGGTGMFQKKTNDSQFFKFADIYNQAVVEDNFIHIGGSNITTWRRIDGSFVSQSSIIPNSFTWSSADEVNHIKDQFFVSLPSRKGIWKLTDQNVWQEFNAGLNTLNSNRIQSLDTLIYTISDNALYKSGITSPKWIKLDNGSPSPISVYALKDSIIVTGSYYNECHISKDRGATWKQIGKSTLDNGPTAFFFDNSTLLVSTYSNIYSTKDLGETWTKTTLVDSLKYSLSIQSILATKDSVYLGTTENGILAFSRELLNKQNQVITFEPLPNRAFGDDPFTLTATSSSGLSIQYSTVSDKVTLSGNQVTLIKPGNVKIKADQSGNSNYTAAATVEQSFCINPAKPIITTSGLDTEVPILTSSSETGNQWFLNGSAIIDANQKTYAALKEGVYTVKSTIDDCASELSAEQILVITGDLNSTFTSSGFLVYPNPVNDEVTIRLTAFNSRLEVKIVIYDTSGKEVERMFRRGEKTTLSVRAYSSGTYFVKASQQNLVYETKFSKE